jgi:predicted GNAT family N-acyltransferase
MRWNNLRDPNAPINEKEVTDAYDAAASTVHGLIVQRGFGAAIVGTGRIHRPIETPELGVIRYMAIDERRRGQGLGRLLLEGMEAQAKAIETGVPLERLEANARVTALGYYETLGYSAIGDEFELVGVPHVRIVKQFTA